MCGIYGMVSLRGAPLANPDRMDVMAAALKHRGPDGSGRLTCPGGAFGTERLRVVDLDARADQPFADSTGSLWLACNGEIYNAPDLRRRFGSYRFRSRSDVETILPLYLARGIDAAAELDGMFAIALWETENRRLVLLRDRAGEKPLFYLRGGGEVWFASEIQALLACPHSSRDLDEVALREYLRAGYVSAPRTMFASIRQVEPGTAVVFDHSGTRVIRYWDPLAIEPIHVSVAEATSGLRERLDEAICRQLVADVPVGVFTSGGMDSTILSARAAQALGPERVRTFAARFVEPSFDESPVAHRVSQSLGTPHRSVLVDEPALRRALDRIAGAVAEPVADPAILPTYVLAAAAREEVTVVLSGEGADELFGGYPTYQGHRLAPAFAGLPLMARRAVAALARTVPASTRKVTVEFLVKRFLEGVRLPWRERHAVWFGTGCEPPAEPQANGAKRGTEPRDAASLAMALDYRSYLPGNLLTKVDRATMQASLEARAPYLDRRVTEFAIALPGDYKLKGFTGKWILRRAAKPWVSPGVLKRRKRGLSVPVAGWINGGLRSEVDRLLDPERLRRQGLVDHLWTRKILAQHRAGAANHGRPLWTLVMLQLWLERWCEEAV